jgi:quercetin dioxygenase-like cupin family protein
MATKFALIPGLILVLFGLDQTVTVLAQESESSGRHVFHKADSAEVFRRGPMVSEFMLTTEQTEGRYSIIKEIFESGQSSYPGHIHQSHSEVFFIISGVMEWTVNADTQQIGPGDLVYIPPNSHHAGRVVGDEDVHAVMLYEPAGYEQNYFRRRALSEEERQDPDIIRELMELGDVHIDR